MKKIFAGIFIVLFLYLAAVLVIVKNCEQNPAYGKVSSVIIDSLKASWTWNSKDSIKLNSLLESFNTTKDEFEKTTWYVHKSFPKWQTALNVFISNQGHYYLESVYFSDDWINHTQIKISLHDSIFESNVIPSYDSHNLRNRSNDHVQERIYFDIRNDGGILKAIAENYQSKIKVRLCGEQNNKDYVLNDKLKNAIKESYELSELLSKKHLYKLN